MNLDLHKIQALTFLTILLICGCILFPGILFLFAFNVSLFKETDAFKLILLCASGSCPIWFINTFIFFLLHKRSEKANGQLDDDPPMVTLQIYSILGSIFSIPVLYIPVLIKLYNDINIESGIAYALSIQILLIIIAFIFRNKVI